MSVKSFFEVAGHRAEFDAFFPDLPAEELGPIRVSSASPASASLLGTAFDYGCRFHLLVRNGRLAVERDLWIAERAPKVAAARGGDAATLASFELALIAGRQAQDRVRRSGGTFDDDALDAIFLLAQLDVVFRTKRLHGACRCPTAGERDELRQALALVAEQSAFTAQKRCLLNPVFGAGSTLIGGADGDVIIDDVLIDLKLSAKSKLQRSWWREVITYLALDDLGTQRGLSGVGIYLARCGTFGTLSADRVRLPSGRYDKFLQWLQLRASQQVGSGEQ
ncbi:MAG: hypothetical protein Q8O67_31685 [Deltaproteobacteria bacterium]|nr:hypothetical protein [Deltaproteobacteria bacterium]